MERRFNGYAPASMKTARALRLLKAHEQLARARRRTVVLLALILPLLLGVAILFLVNGRFKENQSLLLALLGSYVAALVFSFLFFAIGRAIVGGKPDKGRVNRILQRYVCGMLGDTYRMYEREIVGRDHDQLIKRYALEHIADFRLLEGERDRLLTEGALEREAEAIRRRYEDFITYVISGDNEAARYINLRRNMSKVQEKWRHHNLSRYDKPQRAIIEDNVKRITRTVTERYEYFLSHLGTREYILLMNDVIYCDLSEDRSLWKPLPSKKKFKSFCRTVKQIEDSNPSKMVGAGRGNALFDHALALENYRRFTKAYSTAACPTLKWDFSLYEEELAAAQSAQESCWKCGEKYHPRYRELRESCRHYICTRCNVCYCMSPQSRRRRERGAPAVYNPDKWWNF